MFHGRRSVIQVYVHKDLLILLLCTYISQEKLLEVSSFTHKRDELQISQSFSPRKMACVIGKKLISARQQPYGGRSGLSQSNPKDCVWLIILKHNPQISKVPPLLRFISAMTKVIMTRDEEKNLFTNPITQRILSSKR